MRLRRGSGRRGLKQTGTSRRRDRRARGTQRPINLLRFRAGGDRSRFRRSARNERKNGRARVPLLDGGAALKIESSLSLSPRARRRNAAGVRFVRRRYRVSRRSGQRARARETGDKGSHSLCSEGKEAAEARSSRRASRPSSSRRDITVRLIRISARARARIGGAACYILAYYRALECKDLVDSIRNVLTGRGIVRGMIVRAGRQTREDRIGSRRVAPRRGAGPGRDGVVLYRDTYILFTGPSRLPSRCFFAAGPAIVGPRLIVIFVLDKRINT